MGQTVASGLLQEYAHPGVYHDYCYNTYIYRPDSHIGPNSFFLQLPPGERRPVSPRREIACQVQLWADLLNRSVKYNLFPVRKPYAKIIASTHPVSVPAHQPEQMV